MNRTIFRAVGAARRIAAAQSTVGLVQVETRFAIASCRSTELLRSNTLDNLLPRSVLTGTRQFSSKEEDTHPDFKPVNHVEVTEGVNEYIEKTVQENKVFVFMKGHPTQPQCGFSNMACRILDHYQVAYGSVDVLQDPELREGIKKYSNWPTIPQVYVDGEFLGGSDILRSMHESGELKEMFGEPGQ